MPWSLRMTLIVALIGFLSILYHYWRFSWAVNQTQLRKKIYWKSGFAGMILLFFLYPLFGYITYFFSGSVPMDDFPKWMIYLFWYGFIFSTVMLTWVLIADFIRLVTRYLFSVKSQKSEVLYGKVFIGLMIVGLLFTATKTVWDTNRIVVEEIEQPIESSSLSTPLTVVHIADLQADRYTTPEKMAQYIEVVNSFEPDLVVFSGDLVTSGLDYVEAGADAMAGIESTHGTFAVIGDHDYWSGEEEITNALEQRGVQVLRDENRVVDYHGESILLTGVTEIYSTRPSQDRLQELMDGAGEYDFRILLSHQASDRLIEQSNRTGYNQLLYGHTHGGQIKIPVFFQKMTGAVRDTEYVKGHWWFDDMLLNVNSGLGFTLSPVRYNAPAEVSVVRVQ